MKSIFFRVLAAAVAVLASLMLCLAPASQLASAAAQPTAVFPRTANYYLRWDLTESQARELARWDLVILDMEIQRLRPELIKKMRQWNPDIVILVYVTPQEIRRDAAVSASFMRRQFASGLDDSWYLVNGSGQRLNFWPDTYLLNVTKQGVDGEGRRFDKYLVNFVVNELLSTGLWDGVFYDNAWDSVTHFVGRDIDLNRDGAPDEQVDKSWQEGMKFIYRETGRLAPESLIVANGTTRAYRNDLNGNLMENFVASNWSPMMSTYRFNQGDSRYNIINSNTQNRGGSANYREMRFGFGSTLLQDGYYSYDYGDEDHGQLWRYDEYEVSLGRPLSGEQSESDLSVYKPDLWRRDFEHGLAIVNSTPEMVEVALGGEYEKLRGAQDPAVNDGSIVSEVVVDGYDGLILRKTFASLDDVLFANGAFARFFRPGGERVRNGFFVFEEKYKGGDQVAHIDLDGNGARDLLVVSGNKISAWRDDGQPFFKLFPYTRLYAGRLSLAYGKLFYDGDFPFGEEVNPEAPEPVMIVAPGAGHAGPIKFYSLSGEQLRDDWYPFDKKYSGGYNLAVGQIGPGSEPRLIVGAMSPRRNAGAIVAVFDHNLKKISEWPAFEKNFRGGVSVASGDLDGDGRDELVLGAGPGKPPLVRVVDETGREAAPSFNAYSTVGLPGVAVQVADVDFDGRQDIIAFSSEIGI